MRVVAAILSALPDFAMAAVYLITWIDPNALGDDRMVKHLVSVVLLEFIIIHSSAFMGTAAISGLSRWKKVQAILGLSVLYSIFAGAFSLAFKSWWPITAFWALTLNRLLPVLLGVVPSDRQKALIQAGWAGSACMYLIFIFLTILVPSPQFGITPAVVEAQDLTAGSDDPGIWQTEPHRAIAFGFLYFTTIGLLELSAMRWAAAER
ncbi:MAG TPA: hypothetical protein VIL97_02140 [Thermoanaerobaculia bacterium]